MVAEVSPVTVFAPVVALVPDQAANRALAIQPRALNGRIGLHGHDVL